MIGARLGDFTLEAELGRGAMGAVYRARQAGLGRAVAVKVLAGTLRGDEQFAQRFLRGTRALARTNHPNMVPFYGCGE